MASSFSFFFLLPLFLSSADVTGPRMRKWRINARRGEARFPRSSGAYANAEDRARAFRPTLESSGPLWPLARARARSGANINISIETRRHGRRTITNKWREETRRRRLLDPIRWRIFWAGAARVSWRRGRTDDDGDDIFMQKQKAPADTRKPYEPRKPGNRQLPLRCRFTRGAAASL